MSLSRKIALLSQNPRLLFKKILARLLLWRARSTSFSPRIRVKNKIDFDLPDCPERLPYALETYESETLYWMNHFLKPGDIFIDVGANFGFLSAYAAACVGSSGEIHSFEPVLLYYRHLQNTALQNPELNWKVYPQAAGDKPGLASIAIRGLTNPGWNTLVPSFMAPEEIIACQEVEVIRLDDYLKARGLHHVRMIKIDTEGFEFSVLKGLEGYFLREKDRPILFCEVCPMAAEIQGYPLEDMEGYLHRFGCQAYSVLNNRTKIQLASLTKTTDVIFRSDP